jgi:cell division protein FtsB
MVGHVGQAEPVALRPALPRSARQSPLSRNLTSLSAPRCDLLRRVNVNLGIWDKLTKLAIFCLFVLGVICVAVWYLPLINQNERMRQDLLKQETKIKAEQERGHLLRSAVEAAKNNPKTIERMARAALGYAKPGEVIIRFEDPIPRR